MAKLVVLIEVDEKRGKGVEGDPVRLVRQWWTTDGTFVVELDPYKEASDGTR